jgi:hypothetical protein
MQYYGCLLGGKKVKVMHKEVISGVQGTIKRFRINARNQDGSIKYIGLEKLSGYS